ncbi:MAG: hypothetical protein M0Z95_04420 [Actinomycetota bacterium]|nr:hypothetical protein [Actinomycetota bacterium]
MTATGGCCIHGVAYGPGWSCAQCSAAMSEDQRKPGLWIVLDGPPGPVAGRFVDIEDDHERSVGLSGLEWRDEGWVWAIGPFCLRGQLDAAEERLAEAEATIARLREAVGDHGQCTCHYTPGYPRGNRHAPGCDHDPDLLAALAPEADR